MLTVENVSNEDEKKMAFNNKANLVTLSSIYQILQYCISFLSGNSQSSYKWRIVNRKCMDYFTSLCNEPNKFSEMLMRVIGEALIMLMTRRECSMVYKIMWQFEIIFILQKSTITRKIMIMTRRECSMDYKISQIMWQFEINHFHPLEKYNTITLCHKGNHCYIQECAHMLNFTIAAKLVLENFLNLIPGYCK